MNEIKFIKDFKEFVMESNTTLLFELSSILEKEIKEREKIAEAENRTEKGGDWS